MHHDTADSTRRSRKEAKDAKLGTYGKVLMFSYDDHWEGKFYKKKDVAVYYKKLPKGEIVVLTVKAR